MKYNRYLDGVPSVSEIGFGAWQLGSKTIAREFSEKEALDIVRRAIESGVNFFDTAPNYGLGSSEARLGKALKDFDRSQIIINTKFGHTVSGGLDFSSDHIRQSLEGSLKRLNTEYVDSLIIHNPPFEMLDGTRSDHYEILEDLKNEGKIRGYGASVDTFEEMMLVLQTTKSEVIETFFNILHQDTARAFDLAIEKEVSLIGKIPLDSGWLSGKYNESSNFTDIRNRWSKEDIRTRSRLVDRVREIAGQDADLAQVALAFCLSYAAMTTVIPGNSSISQLENNIAASHVKLSGSLKTELEEFYQKEVRHLKLPW